MKNYRALEPTPTTKCTSKGKERSAAHMYSRFKIKSISPETLKATNVHSVQPKLNVQLVCACTKIIGIYMCSLCICYMLFFVFVWSIQRYIPKEYRIRCWSGCSLCKIKHRATQYQDETPISPLCAALEKCTLFFCVLSLRFVSFACCYFLTRFYATSLKP